MLTRYENKTIAVDVDGTLINRFGDLNSELVKYCGVLKSKGFNLFLWSARGAEHAKAVCNANNVGHLFDFIIDKPGAIIDDKGWSWTQYTTWIRDLSNGE